jgi:hypothetical protein
VDERQDREVQRAVRELEQEAEERQERADKLGADIDSVRQEFGRKRNDESVPGLPPEPGSGAERADDPPAVDD